jgi:hypothetical protein
MTKLGVFFLLFGIGSFIIYVSTKGGVYNALKYAQIIRNGSFDITGSLTFFKHFMKIVYFAAFLFWIQKSEIKNNKIKILSALSFFISFLVLIAYFWQVKHNNFFWDIYCIRNF